MKPWLLAATVVGLAMALLASSGVSVSAQPVARIALPEPGEAMDLFGGCNLISLTFPDGTTSEEVTDAVTPPEAVEALWRQTATLERFEGFSPAFPQASDLLTVHRLDPVWICISNTQGPLPPPVGGTPTSVVGTPTAVVGTPTPGPTPAPTSGQLADVAITGLHLQRPEGRVWIWLQNKGPNSLVNATAQLQCTVPSVEVFDDNLVAGSGFQGPISFTLSVGQVGDFSTAMTIDVSRALWLVSCEITNESFTDPHLNNNKKGQWFGPDADLALTDLFTSILPVGDVYTRITNNGPDSLVNALVHLNCSYTMTPEGGAPQTTVNPVVDVRVSLVPGETEAFGTQISVNTFLGKYDVNCELTTSLDPKQANNSYSVTIPAYTIG